MPPFDELPPARRYGPLDSLFAALRRRAPQVSVQPPDDGLRVGYRDRTATIVWDGDVELYLWISGPDGGQLDRDAEKAAEQIAWTLGAPVSPTPSS
ncbi:hypothetical protein AGRA3207_004216 [Actinomadura graeca]|uniref:Uncharacterized protein n=1 Tax=Actinomadura graeca TaxID=2750812 RepID=A0ABX8QWG4_9ACTN|nr:hypothetical protein [Actinomadura graeca]QXJ23100.1 hypothetical protein AGRA3207_004216 [Actinomadura graeca]